MTSSEGGLDRAEQELNAAELLSANGFAAQAVSRSYFAAFFAAEEALRQIGIVRSKHAGVVAAVARELVRERGFDPEAGRLLRSLFERRSRADYGLGDTPAEEATQAVAAASTFVAAIADWVRRPIP